MLNWKYYLIRPLFIDVIVIFSRVPGPIQARFRNELIQLILMSIIFSTTKMLYNICGFGNPAIFKYPMHFPSTCPRFSLMVKTYNFTALKANGITEDIFIKFRAPARLFLICRQVSTDIFVSTSDEHPCILLKIIAAVYQRLNNHGAEHWWLSIKRLCCPYVMLSAAPMKGA